MQAFKRKAGVQEMFAGIVAHDHNKVVKVVSFLAALVARIHALGPAHGELTDSTILLLGGGGDGARPVLPSLSPAQLLVRTLAQVLAVRDNYILFFAPELLTDVRDMLDECVRLRPATHASDVWSLGIIMLLLSQFSLQVTQHSPYVRTSLPILPVHSPWPLLCSLHRREMIPGFYMTSIYFSGTVTSSCRTDSLHSAGTGCKSSVAQHSVRA